MREANETLGRRKEFLFPFAPQTSAYFPKSLSLSCVASVSMGFVSKRLTTPQMERVKEREEEGTIRKEDK